MLHDTSSNPNVAVDGSVERPHSSATPFCTSCQISLSSGQELRAHSKEPWHVHNMRRRIDSLPPISSETFKEQATEKLDIREKRPNRRTRRQSSGSSDYNSEEASDDECDQSAWPFQCLFCKEAFEGDEAGFAANIDHMRLDHGMFIPDQERVVDMQSFMGYLAIEVRMWHECLYCGATKPSTASIQSHMRAKGHCKLNLNREPELFDFWESPGDLDGEESTKKPEQPTRLSETEMRFASGKVVGSRNAVPTAKRTNGRQEPATTTRKALPSNSEHGSSVPPSDEPELSTGRQLARREEMGIVGVSPQQRQALAVAEKKAQRCEDLARRTREWVYARAANSQKFDQIDTTGKWGKQSHKLLPR